MPIRPAQLLAGSPEGASTVLSPEPRAKRVSNRAIGPRGGPQNHMLELPNAVGAHVEFPPLPSRGCRTVKVPFQTAGVTAGTHPVDALNDPAAASRPEGVTQSQLSQRRDGEHLQRGIGRSAYRRGPWLRPLGRAASHYLESAREEYVAMHSVETGSALTPALSCGGRSDVALAMRSGQYLMRGAKPNDSQFRPRRLQRVVSQHGRVP